jgi:hypothetical protein
MSLLLRPSFQARYSFLQGAAWISPNVLVKESPIQIVFPSWLVVPLWKGTHVAPTAPVDGPSKLASDPLRDKADWPLTARFDEHRPKCNNKFRHACALGEHKRPTAFVIRLPRVRTPGARERCAYPSSRNSGVPPFASARTDQADPPILF